MKYCCTASRSQLFPNTHLAVMIAALILFKMNTALYSLTINQYDTLAGTTILNSCKISVCSGAQTLVEIIKEKTNINPPNIHCIYAWYNAEAEGQKKKVIITPDAPLAATKISDNTMIGVYLFQASILPSLDNRSFCKWSKNNWRAKFEDDKIPSAILRTPPEAVKDLLMKLTPVHSCSVDTLIKIIHSGAVKARSRLAPPPFGGLPSVYTSFMENFQSRFTEIMKDKQCPWDKSDTPTSISRCYHCIEKVINLAEVMVAANRLGNTRVIQLRRARFELYFPTFTKEDFDRIEQVALSLASDPNTSRETGIGYWVDEFLGTHEHVFAVMGPNTHYGPVSIIFKRNVCDDSTTKISMNSSTTIVSGHALPLRPWLKLAGKEFKATQYGGNVWPDSTFYESIGADLSYFMRRSSHYGATATRGELELLKQLQRKELCDFKGGVWFWNALQEITSQGILAFLKDRSKYEVEPNGDYISPSRVQSLKYKSTDEHFSWEPKMDLISGSFPPDERKKDRPEDVTTQDIIDWYMNVDPHGRLEALLPSSIPLADVATIIIPRTAVTTQLAKLLRETKVGARKLIDIVVFTENEEESLKWQQQYFSVLADC